MRFRRATATTVLLAALTGCGAFVEYTDDLRTAGERSRLVRYTAQFGGLLGFAVGIPVDIVALPVTDPVYLVQSRQDPENTDFGSTVLFPSFALLQAGSLLAAPFDAVEFLVYRAWQPPETATAEEQEELEIRIDEETLPRYPVTPLYPLQS
jgi:hypothetical protein